MAGEVAFTLTEADYLAANRDYFARSRFRPGVLAKSAGIFAFWMGVGFLMALNAGYGAGDSAAILIGLAVFYVAIILLCWLLAYLSLPRRARRIYAQQKSFERPWHYTWSEDGLAFSSPNTTSIIPWSDMYRWTDGRRALLFFVNELIFWPVPLRVLSAEQAEDLRALASKLGPARL